MNWNALTYQTSRMTTQAVAPMSNGKYPGMPEGSPLIMPMVDMVLAVRRIMSGR